MRLSGILLAVAATVALSATAAHADPTARDKAAAQQAYAAGQSRYDAGDFLGAAEQFSAAYQHDPDPVYLFNLAQAYRFAKRCRDAGDSYRRFLAAAPDAPNRDKVQHYLEEVDACARSQAPAEPSAPNPGPASGAGTDTSQPAGTADQAAPGHDSTAAPASEPGSATAVEAETPPDHGHALRVTGLALGAAGVVGLAAGGYYTWDVSHITDERDRTCKNNGCDGLQLRHFDDRGTSAEHAEIAAYAIGGAALAAGILLLVHEHHAHHAMALGPTAGGAMAVVVVSY